MEVVIVTGAGGPAGIAVIQELQKLGHRTIGVDASPYAAGIRLADIGAVIPRADDRNIKYAIDILAKTHGATVLVSTIPDEAVFLDDLDIPHWFPSQSAIRICTDKWAFHAAMLSEGITVPDTSLNSTCTGNGPWVIKPRYGSGSRGIRYADHPATVDALFSQGDILQSAVSGREFTADCLVDRDGALIACVPRWRLETRGGISTKGETLLSDEITVICGNVLQTVGLLGIANVQGFVNRSGVTIIECNPRFSGGLPLTVHAGANLPDAFVSMICDPSYIPQISYRPQVRMTRYFSSIFDN